MPPADLDQRNNPGDASHLRLIPAMGHERPQRSPTQAGQGDGGRDGQRSCNRGGGREGGGFRIRLSDNEMRSARALQEAFNLRSTVAVLGFAVRSLGQMLEDGQLDALIEQQRSTCPWWPA